MKKILVTGANGLLGQKLVKYLSKHHHIMGTGREDHFVAPELDVEYRPLDITNARECRDLIYNYRPDIIINAASYTNVDGCELNKAECWAVNVKGVENLAFAARRDMAMVIHISTDYVFDGANGPYTEDDKPNPISYYGKAKLASENVVRMEGVPFAIARTSVLFGSGKQVKNNFFLWVYRNLKENKTIRVVTDQYNTPTLVEDLAIGIHLLIEKSRFGLFHLSGSEFLNRYEFAMRIARTFDFDTDLIQPIPTSVLQQPASRPPKAGLRAEKARNELGFNPHSIKDACRYLKSQLKDMESD